MLRFWTIVLLLVPTLAIAEDLEGVVTRVVDGDTYVMRTADGTTHKVRQQSIDAPETTQPFGDVATEFNTYLLLGRNVIVRTEKKDFFGRTLGRTSVKIGDAWYDAERIMISSGLAWHYQQYDKNEALDALEDYARSKRKGLWIEDYPTPPWQYRHDRKKND